MSADDLTVLVCVRDRFTEDLVIEALAQGGLRPVRPAVEELVLAAARRTGAAVVLLDLALEVTSAGRLEPTLVALLRRGARILLVADDVPRERVLLGLLSGASGQVTLGSTSPHELLEAVRQVAEGSAALHPEVAAAVLERWRAMRAAPVQEDITLSGREAEVLELSAEGLTNQAIARRLGVSSKTVEAHKGRLFVKLGARNQAHAVAVAIQRGLLSGPSRSGEADTDVAATP